MTTCPNSQVDHLVSHQNLLRAEIIRAWVHGLVDYPPPSYWWVMWDLETNCKESQSDLNHRVCCDHWSAWMDCLHYHFLTFFARSLQLAVCHAWIEFRSGLHMTQPITILALCQKLIPYSIMPIDTAHKQCWSLGIIQACNRDKPPKWIQNVEQSYHATLITCMHAALTLMWSSCMPL